MKQLRKHLNVSTLLSCIALFVALGGAAYAAGTLTKKSVKTQHLANGSVTTQKLRNGAVTNPKLRNGTITGAKIAPGSIGSGQLANGSVRSGQLGGGVVTEAKIKNSAVGETKLGTNAVSAGKIQEGAVTGAKLSASLYAQLVKNVTYANKETIDPSATNPQSVTAECPAGKQAIGGGPRIQSGDAAVVQIVESIPFVAGDGKRTGWTVTAKTAEAGKTFGVGAVAICAEF